MSSKGIVIALVLGVGLMSVGCADTCRQTCNFAADYVESCMPQWNVTWENFDADWSSKADYRKACNDSANEGRGQVADCCPEEDAEAACEGSEEDDCVETKKNECENNALLAIDRNCEDVKDSYRQPCSDYWQSVYVMGGPQFPEENPTCQDPDAGDDDDDDTTGE